MMTREDYRLVAEVTVDGIIAIDSGPKVIAFVAATSRRLSERYPNFNQSKFQEFVWRLWRERG